MSKPFGIATNESPRASAGQRSVPALSASNLEATKEWQELRTFIERSIDDLKELAATRTDTLEHLAAVQGQVLAYRTVLLKVEEWNDAR